MLKPKDRNQSVSGYIQPAEWQIHDSCWLAWPSDATLWKENLKPAQEEFTRLCRAIADVDPLTNQARGESLQILVPNETVRAEAEKVLQGLPVRFHLIPYGDIWLRDTAPIFLTHPSRPLACASFRFNGWGEKYALPFDGQVAERIAQTSAVQHLTYPWVLEGGSVEVDGLGTCLTTIQCLMNPNRNPGMTQKQVEEGLKEALGLSQILWLNEGLLNDHTDGHIDTLARFVAPGVVACMKSQGAGIDPNHLQLEAILKDLKQFTDAQGRKLQVVEIPSPGAVLSPEGELMPASYMNFYIANTTVVVPTYGSPMDEQAVQKISELFPTRKTIGCSAYAILSGGGAFHCITQQQPQVEIQ
ncbi:MAG: agmatine deiminase family protein [Bdellovibrionia bacterium]